MTGPRPLAVTQKQVTAILKGAARAGVQLKITAREGEVIFTVNRENGIASETIQPAVKTRPNFDI